jgi:hypothetical protein
MHNLKIRILVFGLLSVLVWNIQTWKDELFKQLNISSNNKGKPFIAVLMRS